MFENERIEKVLESLSKSKFRSGFSLKQKDIDYVKSKGMETIEEHANDFISKRLAPEFIPNDGKQTPMKGHPVFIAQHATATCCRKCLYKWHRILPNKELSRDEKSYVIRVIMAWIAKEMTKK